MKAVLTFYCKHSKSQTPFIIPLPIGLDPDLIFDMKSSQRELLSVLGLSFLLNVTLYF